MKSLTLTCPDSLFDSVVEALCSKGNWQQTADTTLGEAGKLEFAKGMLLDYFGEVITQHETAKVQEVMHAQQQATQAIIQAANVAARGSVVVDIATV